eukprot:CAMPEP_0198275246 /NCGR_PEP_ID=MMETSP1447-20131203/63743_1 /TAXON_ID=420782 /ORGANISM="Chaetoceros dichaeta, Strain CCMP1751" /LENGTH=63 /DNA_ID=CAMNT_0043969937 /DNA_START=106 /DNA_END=294 /DNA_ORIENTATION=+
MSSIQNQRLAGIGMSLLFAGIASLLLYYGFRTGRPDPASTKLLKTLDVPPSTPPTDDDDDDDE